MTEILRTIVDSDRERAILVGAGMQDYSDGTELHVLDELAELSRTAGCLPVGRLYQRRQMPDNKLFVGKGKAQEVASAVRDLEADVVLFDNDLTPRQLRNLEEIVCVKIIDRSEVILDIFADHAKTIDSRLQVELAQLHYLRPRLKRMWTHLSRIAGQGGIGSRGPGEKQIETDRRLIDRRLVQLERELDEIKSRRERQVATRSNELTVSLVGYTNAGKSTLMNKLTGAGVYQADQLFATLDTKTSHFDLPSGHRIMISDTVGFIRDLPHHLVASFHATLEEVRQSRLLLHIVDASSPEAMSQAETVNQVLEDSLNLIERDEFIVLNKVDRVEDVVAMNRLRTAFPDALEVSALTGQGIDALVAAIEDFDNSSRQVIDLTLDAGDGRTLSLLNQHGEILETNYEGNKVHISVSLPNEAVGRFAEFQDGDASID